MPLLADDLPVCETANQVVDSIFLDTSAAVFDIHHRHLMKCWLQKHFVSTTTAGHSVCLAQFEAALCTLIEETAYSDAKWHLRFVNGFQLLSECDSPIRCLLGSATCAQKIVDYFAFAINKFIANVSNSNSSSSGSGGGGGLVYLEAKLLLKLVQTFSRIFGKIPPQNDRSVLRVPAHLINALWILAACDLYELDLRQASTNLIVQLVVVESIPHYNSFRERAIGLIEKLVPQERQPTAKLCLQILGVGAFCSQLSPAQLITDEMRDGRVLLLVLLEDISSCSSSRMSASLAIAFYRSLHSWTKAAVSVCALQSKSIWNETNVSTVFRLFLQLIEHGWDSHAEVVRDLVSEVFESILVLFKNTMSISSSRDTFLEDLICTLLRTDWQSRLKYRPLSQITELFGPDILFQSASKVGINIPEKVSPAFNDRAIAPHAATFIAAILKSATLSSASSLLFVEEDFLEELIRNVVEAAISDDAVTRHFVTFAVPKLLKARGKRFVDVIIQRASAKHGNFSDAEYLILFSVCRSARASGLYELEEDSGSVTKLAIMLNESLNHSNIHIRLEAFGFLCENIRIAQPIYAWELDAIERFIGASFKIDSSDFRQSYSSLFRKFLNRLRDSGNGAERQKNVREYANFLDRILGLCFESLAFNGAAFARRSTALTTLTIIAKVFPDSSSWFNFSKDFYEKRQSAGEILLRALIRDTYEDNKKMAFDLLAPYWQKSDQVVNRDAIFQEATRLSQSTHPQNGMTAAYLFKLLATRSCHNNGGELVRFVSDTLLTSLREQVEVARSDLAKAAVSRPIYPTVTCIRYIIAEFRQFFSQIIPEFRKFSLELIATLRAVADTVTPVIAHQSPEGLQLNDVENENETENDEEINDPLGLLPEFLTVCCWRSIKEVSLTLSLLVEISIENDESNKLLEIDEIKSIGGFFSEMLLKARHRGAFEIAYAGFDHICAKLWRSQSPSLNVLPSLWLKPLLTSFESTGGNVSLSSTRRSAGLPFYFMAVVGNEPRLTRSVSVSLLETVLNLLIRRALQSFSSSNEEESVRVHALNVLRALIRDSRLEQAVSPFLGETFVAAMTALMSKNWSLRNSGTLLFSALMTRIFGVHRDKFSIAVKNKMTARLFFALYPNLFEFLLNFFSVKNEAVSSVAVTFLSLLEHLYPSPFDVNENGSGQESGQENVPQVNVFAFIPALVSLLGHRSIRVRIMSSRSIRNFVTVDSLPILLEKLVQEWNSNRGANFQDGCFILLRKLAAMFASDLEALEVIKDVSLLFATSVGRENDFVNASIFHLLIKLIEIRQEKTQPDGLTSLSFELSTKIIEKSLTKTSPSTVLIRAVQCSILAISREKNCEKMVETLKKYLIHPNKFVRSATVDCLNEILLRQFFAKERSDGGLVASLFDENAFRKDEEYVSVDFRNTISLEDANLLQLTWQQLNKIDVAENKFETSKLLTLFSFFVLLKNENLEKSLAEEAFGKFSEIISNFGLLSELAQPCSRALGAIAPFLAPDSQNRVVEILSKMVSASDDQAKFRTAIFGLSRLPKACVLASDPACDVVLTVLTSSEPDIRILASWYVTRKLCPVDLHLPTLHSGQALIVFACLVVENRPISNAVDWLLAVATTPKRMMTTEGAENLQIVFEAEETNPFSEDRLVSNVCVLLISVLLNGVKMTLGTIFPRLRLPVPIVRCLGYFFPSSLKEEKTDHLLALIMKSQLIISKEENQENPSREKLSEAIFSSLFLPCYEFLALMRRQLPVQAVMPRSDIVYQRLLMCKVLNPNGNFNIIGDDRQKNETVKNSDKNKSTYDNLDTFLLGDSIQLDTILIC